MEEKVSTCTQGKEELNFDGSKLEKYHLGIHFLSLWCSLSHTNSSSLGLVSEIFWNVVIPAFTRAFERAGPTKTCVLLKNYFQITRQWTKVPEH